MRYFLDQDDSCHWYLVPMDKRNEWEYWCGLEDDCEESWEVPEWAKRLDGHPRWISFTDPQVYR